MSSYGCSCHFHLFCNLTIGCILIFVKNEENFLLGIIEFYSCIYSLIYSLICSPIFMFGSRNWQN